MSFGKRQLFVRFAALLALTASITVWSSLDSRAASVGSGHYFVSLAAGPANGINNLGDVVGRAVYYRAGFLYQDPIFNYVSFPEADVTWASGNNDAGTIVGYYQLSGEINRHAFLLNDATYTSFDYPGAAHTTAFDINNAGSIVGGYHTSPSGEPTETWGFVKHDSSFETIAYPGANTHATGINDSGQIVGFYADASGVHGYLYEESEFTTVDYPGALGTYLGGINNQGQIVGRYQTASGETHGFLKDGDTYISFDVPLAAANAGITWANGISDSGQVVGTYVHQDSNGATFWIGFIATPAIGAQIDVNPGKTPNEIRPWTKPRVPVAVLTTGEFDALSLDLGSVNLKAKLWGTQTPSLLPGAYALRWRIRDIDHDGDDDVLCDFPVDVFESQYVIEGAILQGYTLSGDFVVGEDSVQVVTK
jgi:probable HAF family extracellular repeat protein